jgi:nucleoside-diphosphate-sugar epimerase
MLGIDYNVARGDVIKRMMEGKKVIIHGDGSNLWTMTHASDFAVGFIGLMGNVHAIGEAFHITSDESLTWYHMYKIVADALGVEFKPIFVSTTFLDGCSSYGYKSGIIGDKGNSLVFDNSTGI